MLCRNSSQHVRLGGSTGTGLTTSECLKLQVHGMECSSAFLSVHITGGASAYLEVSLRNLLCPLLTNLR